MTADVDRADPAEAPFEYGRGFLSWRVCEEILEGRTYPALPFVDDVRVVVDAGANVGATSVYFAQRHPDATIHAVEPARESLESLVRNTSRLPNVVVHPVGLAARDGVATLHHGRDDSGSSSIHRAEWHDGTEETITLRAAGAWAAENGIDRIDVLKVDVEGCEYEVLHSLRHLLPTVKVVYVEYGQRELRRSIVRLLDPTHDLYFGLTTLDQGECIYLRRDLADHPDARPFILQIVAANQAPPPTRRFPTHPRGGAPAKRPID